MKPSPLTILMLVAILLGGVTLWFVLEIQQHVAAEIEADMLNENGCRSIGNKRVPCPKNGE